MKASFFKVVLFASAALLSSLSCAENAHPNFLLIIADDLGWADVAVNNPKTFYETPNLDGLAKSGVNFTNGYSVSSVCSPSRYAIETGKYPTRAGLTNFLYGKRNARFASANLAEGVPAGDITIAQMMKRARYSTFFAGKYHLGSDKSCWADKKGYDINLGGAGRGSPGKGGYFSPYNNPRLEDGPAGEYLPERLTAEAQKFLNSKHGAPFFACVSYYLVHTPLMAPKPLVEKYEKKAKALGLNPEGEYKNIEQVWPDAGERRARTVQSNPTYAAMVETLDTCVGRLISTLKDAGLYEDTVIIFFSDNGGLSTAEGHATSNEPLRAGKGWTYEGGVRVPMFVSVPKKFLKSSEDKNGRAMFECPVPVSGADFYPTVCALAGINIGHPVDGESMENILSKKSDEHKPIFWHYPHYSNQGGMPSGGVRSGDWKLIESFEDGAVELYDISKDISETRNLASENPKKVAELKALLHAWYKDVGAEFLQPLGENKNPWRPE